MADLSQLKEDLVTANRILAENNVVDRSATCRSATRQTPATFMTRARAPMCVEVDDIMEFKLDGSIVGPEPGNPTRSGSSTAPSWRPVRTSCRSFTITVPILSHSRL